MSLSPIYFEVNALFTTQRSPDINAPHCSGLHPNRPIYWKINAANQTDGLWIIWSMLKPIFSSMASLQKQGDLDRSMLSGLM